MFKSSRWLYWLGLAHSVLGAAIDHTRTYHTLQAVEEGVQVAEAVAGVMARSSAAAGPVVAPSPTDPATAAAAAARVAEISAAAAAKGQAPINSAGIQ